MLNHVLSNHLLKKDIEMSHWSIYKPEKVPKKIKGLMTVFSMLINKMVKQQRKFFLELFKFSGGFFLQENQKSSHSLCPLPSSWSNKRFYLNWLSHLCGLRLILIEYGFTENAIEKSREDYFQMPKRRLCSFYQHKAKKKFWELVTLLGISTFISTQLFCIYSTFVEQFCFTEFESIAALYQTKLYFLTCN